MWEYSFVISDNEVAIAFAHIAIDIHKTHWVKLRKEKLAHETEANFVLNHKNEKSHSRKREGLNCN
jgi:hypothetical protein